MRNPKVLRDAQDPDSATLKYINQSKVAGKSPDESVKILLPEEPTVKSWSEAKHLILEFYREQMNGGSDV